MDINNAVRPGSQASLHERVVQREVRGVECTAEDAVGEVLPAYWEAEGVEAVVLGRE